MDTTSYLSLDALAVTLGLPRKYLREQASAGKIPSLKIGRRVFFDAGEVRKALAANAGNARKAVAHGRR
jgi:excisionase family DNA binding protein